MFVLVDIYLLNLYSTISLLKFFYRKKITKSHVTITLLPSNSQFIQCIDPKSEVYISDIHNLPACLNYLSICNTSESVPKRQM